MNMTKREKILIILVLILAVVCIYYFYFLQPTLKELETLNSKKSSSELTIQTNIQMQKKTEEIIQKIADEQEQIAQFSSNTTEAFDQPPVLVYLYRTINKYGQKITINFEESKNVGQIKVTTISATLTGDYIAIKNILKELAEGEYFIKVIGISISSDLTQFAADPASQAEEPAAGVTDEPSDSTSQQSVLNINLSLEFYNIGDEIPPDKTYPFTSGAVQYGGNIFF